MKTALMASILCVTLASCESGESRRARIEVNYFNDGGAIYERYLQGDASKAKIALEDLIALTEKVRKQSPKDLGFDWALALCHVRLHYLVLYAGKSEEARQEWDLAVQHWHLSNGKTTLTPEAMKYFVKELEREDRLPWLKEEEPNSEGRVTR